MIAAAGTRVTVRVRVLERSERMGSLPEDTARQPYEIVIRGLLARPAGVGQVTTVRTAAGRLVSGVVDEVEPADEHGFGRPVPALVAADDAIDELRRVLDG